MKLYLIRHAQAEDGSPDFERRLTEAGRERTRKLAKWLAPWLEGARLVSSPAARALETAEILEHRISFGGKLEREPLFYGGSLADAAKAIGRWEHPVLAVVGHEPIWSELASQFVWGSPAPGLDLKKGGVIRLDFRVGRASLRWLLDPKLIERV